MYREDVYMYVCVFVMYMYDESLYGYLNKGFFFYNSGYKIFFV